MEKPITIPDHAPRILALQRAAAEAAAMEPLNKYAYPLFGVIAVLFAIIFSDIAWHVWNTWRDTQRQNEVMVMCLNGHPVALGRAIVRCQIEEYKLVASLAQQEEQP